jgi:hypothetical protein
MKTSIVGAFSKHIRIVLIGARYIYKQYLLFLKSTKPEVKLNAIESRESYDIPGKLYEQFDHDINADGSDFDNIQWLLDTHLKEWSQSPGKNFLIKAFILVGNENSPDEVWISDSNECRIDDIFYRVK